MLINHNKNYQELKYKYGLNEQQLKYKKQIERVNTMIEEKKRVRTERFYARN